MLKIDKSVFTAEELEQYEALIAKATVDTEANKEEEEKKAAPPKKTEKKEEVEEGMEKKKCEKSAEPSPELKAALEEVANLKKSFEMQEMTQVAKKYASLGKKEEELGQILYDMKKSNEANYNAYIAVLDEHLALVEKSGVFTEIGKGDRGAANGGVLDKIEAAATEIQKSDASMSRVQAVAKAWENHPELVAEYDAEYKA